MKSTVCIIDAFSTGADLPWRFKAVGSRVIHIHNAKDSPDLVSSFDASCIDKNYFVKDFNSIEDLFDAIKKENPSTVISGTETSIELTDELNHYLALPGNNITSSSLRRNKTEMQLALKHAGLNHITGLTVKREDLSVSCIESEIGLPCVVKPEESAGADNVYFCNAYEEAIEAANNIIGHKNKIGGFNRKALIQEQIIGQQYFVNAISSEGTHKITEIWEDNKISTPEGRIVCDREILLDGEGDIQSQIRDYICGVLEAVGIQNGASHSELILSNEQNLILIETAARMQGSILATAVEHALGYSHPSLVTDFAIKPRDWFDQLPDTYSRNKHLNVVTLISKLEGYIIKNKLVELLNTLPSYYGIIHTLDKGDYLNVTVDLFTNPGIIYLCSDDKSQIESDYIKIRQWESDGAFFILR